MRTLANNPNADQDFQFVDAIRGIAMISIVVEHCVSAVDYYDPRDGHLHWVYLVMMQAAKFGTICFFLIGGFLLSGKFTQYTPGQYFKRRWSNTLAPWIFWSIAFAIIHILTLVFKKPFAAHPDFNLNRTWSNIKGLYLNSNYWFVINFMFGLCLLSAFRRQLYSAYLGLILFAFTLAYAVNIHFEFMPPRHTTAILGFVFFLWLGAMLREYWDRVSGWIDKIPFYILWPLVLGSLVLGVYEADGLYYLTADPTNTLRASSILYSLLVFIVLLKTKPQTIIKVLEPRETTYGIYLIHFILVFFLTPFILSPFKIIAYTLSPTQFVLYRVSFFIISYVLTVFIVRMLNKTPAKKLIGN